MHLLLSRPYSEFATEPREVLNVREWMNVTEPYLLASCRLPVICRFESGMAVSASG